MTSFARKSVCWGLKLNLVALNRGGVRKLSSDRDALDAVDALVPSIAESASRRDAERELPWKEVELLSTSGLTAITVPAAYGGAGVSIGTLVEVTERIAAADPSLAQIPQNHFANLERLRLYGSDEQRNFFYPRILAGDRLGNATAEPGDKHPNHHATQVRKDGVGYRISGRKIYSTGALFAHWVPVTAVDESGAAWVVYVPRHAKGVEVIDDWEGFGQRTTASGTVVLDDVYVEPISMFASSAQAKKFDTTSAVPQIIHVAIDLGIGRCAVEEAIRFLKTSSNPGRGSGVSKAVEDTLAVREVGALKLQHNVAKVMTERAAGLIDAAVASGRQVDAAAASTAVAEAKILSTEFALTATNKLFELAGTHSTLKRHNLDRHWRNARTHTLHDAVRWKYHAVGNYYLNGLSADPWTLGHPYTPTPEQ